MPPKIDALLFDLDGTLIDSRADLSAAMNAALRFVGRPEKPESEIVPHIGNGAQRLVSGVMGPASAEMLQEALNQFQGYYDAHCLDATVLYAGVLAALPLLAQTARLAVVTNKPERFSRKILKGLGVETFFSSIVGGDSTTERKPHPAPVLKALEQISSEAATAMFVGDGAQDLSAGQAAGTRTCLATYGYGFSPDAEALKPDFSIDAFEKLKEIVL